MGAFIKHRRLGAFLGLAAASLLCSCASVPAADGPKLAITIDDIPVHGPMPAGMTAMDVNREMIAALKAGGVPGVSAYINGTWTERDPQTMAAVQAWQQAGMQLGNHTWSHLNLNDLSVEDYKKEIVRNEPLLAKVADGEDWHWFRYPFLAEGDDPAKRTAIRQFLKERGYKIAGVTMSFSDWQFTAAYARCKDSGNAAAIGEMEALYLQAVRDNLEYSRGLTTKVYGEQIPLVLLMHVGAMSAHMMPKVIEIYRSAGYRFVSIAEAQAHSAYAEDVDPALPPRSGSLESLPAAKGIHLPSPADNQARLDAMCPGGTTKTFP
ncbi:MAG: polysaccharide deacetylase family protein [Sphingomicrobium sp.]